MQRRREPEWMDQPTIDPADHEYALASLERINRLVPWNRMLARYIAAWRQPGLRIIDLGAGGGGLLGFIARQRWETGLLVGIDRSAFALARGRQWHGPQVLGMAADALRLPLADGSIDVVTSSLFLHHLDEADVVRILREAARVCRMGLVLGDLSRSWLAWVITWLTTRLVSRSRVFHVDGVISVRAAFKADELQALAGQAGLVGARVDRRFPFRLVLVWRKPGGSDAG